MNKILDYSIIILNDIIAKDIPFSIAVKNLAINKKIDRATRSSITSLTGAALRHYYVLEDLLNRKIEKLDDKTKYALMIYLTNYLFVKKIDLEELKADLKCLLIENNVDFDVSSLDDVTLTTLINPEINNKSNEFLSLRFNTPLWLVKMWKKHYGDNLTYRILKGLNNKETTFVLINSHVLNKEEFLAKYNDFVPFDDSDLLIYTGKEPFKKTSAYLNNDAFLFKSAENNIFPLLDLDETRGIAIYGGSYNTFHLAAMSTLSHLCKLEIIVPKTSAYFEYKKDLEKYDLKHVSLYEVEPCSVVSCISKKIHTFIVYPRCSSFALLRQSPDFFLRCDKEKMDQYIEESRSTLLECSKLVEEDGQLLFVLPTISKKESHQVVVDFLKENNQFTLVEEKQYLPIDKFDSCLYFALLKRISLDD